VAVRSSRSTMGKNVIALNYSIAVAKGN
jgi:hypothetical protein